MNYYEILTVITLLFLLVAAVSLNCYTRKNHLLIRENRDLCRKNADLCDKCLELKDRIEETKAFKSNLADAEITTNLQATRILYQFGETGASTPERYNYINALSKNGMSPEKIADLLSISIHEAEQLVNLSKLSGEYQPS